MALRSKSKHLAHSQYDVSEWSNMSIKQVGQVQCRRHHRHLKKVTCSCYDIAERFLSWHKQNLSLTHHLF